MRQAFDDQAPDALRRGVEALGLVVSKQQQQQLLAYMALIQKWNKVYNLTALREAPEILTHHVLDSLSVIGPLLRQIEGGGGGGGGGGHSAASNTRAVLEGAEQGAVRSLAAQTQTASAPSSEFALPRGQAPGGQLQRPLKLLDVGSGGGLPGVVIAICCPDIAVTCVDAVSKKAAFVQQVAASLQLPNLKGLHARVETLQGPFDVICSRAFASLADFVAWSGQALAQGGIWMAMKGRTPQDEVVVLPQAFQVFHVEQLQVPGLDAQRCVVWMKNTPTMQA